MSRLKSLYALPCGLILSATLLGCATYEKCGFDGCTGDAKVTSDVTARLKQHRELGPPNRISVETSNHVVYLSGEVSEGSLDRMAEWVAGGTPGVVSVVNTITVKH